MTRGYTQPKSKASDAVSKDDRLPKFSLGTEKSTPDLNAPMQRYWNASCTCENAFVCASSVERSSPSAVVFSGRKQ